MSHESHIPDLPPSFSNRQKRQTHERAVCKGVAGITVQVCQNAHRTAPGSLHLLHYHRCCILPRTLISHAFASFPWIGPSHVPTLHAYPYNLPIILTSFSFKSFLVLKSLSNKFTSSFLSPPSLPFTSSLMCYHLSLS